MSEQSGQLPPPIPPDWGYAFYYGSLSWITVYYRVDLQTLARYLDGTGFSPPSSATDRERWASTPWPTVPSSRARWKPPLKRS